MPEEKRIIEAQPSLVIAYCEKGNKVLTSVYDAGYRKGKSPYVLTPNIIGGNPDLKYVKNGPLEVLVREINEEFDPEFQIEHPDTNQFRQRVAWATPEDIGVVRNALFEGIEPYQDFFVDAQSFREGTATYKAIYSYFFSNISPEVIDVVESNLRRQKSLSPEGLVGVFTLEELEKDPRGMFGTAHITAPALNHCFETNIPYPEEYLRVSVEGIPRESYTGYLLDFEYSKVRKPNHNDPSKEDPSFHEVIFGVEKE